MRDERMKAPIAGVIYGEIVYWGLLAACVLVVVGSVLSFLGDNYVPVSYWLSSIWQGESVAEIWKGAVGSLPNGHWYLSHLSTGDGLTALGISLGVFPVIPGLLLCGLALLKEREIFYGLLAIGCGLVVIVGLLGLVPAS